MKKKLTRRKLAALLAQLDVGIHNELGQWGGNRWILEGKFKNIQKYFFEIKFLKNFAIMFFKTLKYF